MKFKNLNYISGKIGKGLSLEILIPTYNISNNYTNDYTSYLLKKIKGGR